MRPTAVLALCATLLSLPACSDDGGASVQDEPGDPPAMASSAGQHNAPARLATPASLHTARPPAVSTEQLASRADTIATLLHGRVANGVREYEGQSSPFNCERSMPDRYPIYCTASFRDSAVRGQPAQIVIYMTDAPTALADVDRRVNELAGRGTILETTATNLMSRGEGYPKRQRKMKCRQAVDGPGSLAYCRLEITPNIVVLSQVPGTTSSRRQSATADVDRADTLLSIGTAEVIFIVDDLKLAVP